MFSKFSGFAVIFTLLIVMCSGFTVKAQEPVKLLEFRADNPGIQTNEWGNITLWPNPVNSALDAVQGFTYDGPTLVTVEINGFSHPALHFDGEQLLESPIAQIPVGSLFIVMKTTEPLPENQRVVGWGDSNGGQHGLELSPNLAGMLYAVLRNHGADGSCMDAGKPNVDYEVIGVTWGAAGTSLSRNGVVVSTKTAITSLSSDPNILALQIGGPGSGNIARFRGDILELRVYDQQLAGNAKSAVETELFNRCLQNPILPSLLSTAPTGQGFRTNAPIQIQLADGLTKVATSTVQLFLNGAAVQPTVSKPGTTNITTISFTPTSPLPLGSNSVQVIYGNDASPSVLQTNQYSFGVVSDAEGALVINIDFKGVRNVGTTAQTPFVTYTSQSSAGGSRIWNGVPVNSIISGGNNNDYLTVTANNLVNSLGDPTTVSFVAGPVGGGQSGNAPDNQDEAQALMNDYLFNNMPGNLAGLSPFTISGLGTVPTVDLYFFLSNGTVAIPGVSPSPFTGVGIQVGPNIINPLYLRVPVSGGALSGVLGKGTVILGGMIIKKPAPQPYVLSAWPTGTSQNKTPTINVQLQDYGTQVNSGSVQMLIDGQAVTPTVSKPGAVTAVSYVPTREFATGSHTVQVVFADSTTPPLVQTNSFSFTIPAPPPSTSIAGLAQLDVNAGMVTAQVTGWGPTDPRYKVVGDPVPFGCANNDNDAGWIWNPDSYFVVDFGVPVSIQAMRVYSSYPGGQRGADWSIDNSDDNASWFQTSVFHFVTTKGGGVNDDGTVRPDFGGWYQANFNSAEAHRYWRVMHIAATVIHSPRCAQVQFFGKSVLPLIKSVSPQYYGPNFKDAVINIQIQDDLAQLVPASVQFTLNGVALTPTLTKPEGTNVTTITYDAKGALPVGLNSVTIVYNDNANPPDVLTNSFSFVVEPDDYLTITPDMLFGSTTFLAISGPANFTTPIPYGYANNTQDSGWVFVPGSFFYVDFGTPTVVNKVRAFCAYADQDRGAVFTIEYSNNNLSYTTATNWTYQSGIGLGRLDDGTYTSDYSGWYEVSFNTEKAADRYWRIREISVTVVNAPRTAQVEFYGSRTEVVQIRLNFARQGNNVVLSWTGTATLQSADAVTGPWTNMTSLTSPQTVNTTQAQKFYRLKQ